MASTKLEQLHDEIDKLTDDNADLTVLVQEKFFNALDDVEHWAVLDKAGNITNDYQGYRSENLFCYIPDRKFQVKVIRYTSSASSGSEFYTFFQFNEIDIHTTEIKTRLADIPLEMITDEKDKKDREEYDNDEYEKHFAPVKDFIGNRGQIESANRMISTMKSDNEKIAVGLGLIKTTEFHFVDIDEQTPEKKGFFARLFGK